MMRGKRDNGYINVSVFLIILVFVVSILSINNNLLVSKAPLMLKDNLIDNVNSKNGMERLYGDILDNPMISGSIEYEDIGKSYEIEELEVETINREIDGLSNFYIESILNEPVKVIYNGPELVVGISIPIVMNGGIKEYLGDFKYPGDSYLIRKEEHGIEEGTIMTLKNDSNGNYGPFYSIIYKDLKTRTIEVTEDKEIKHTIEINIDINNNTTVKEVYKTDK